MGNESRTGIDGQKGLIGIKASEFLSPEEAKAVIPDFELPEGARAYIKRRSMPLGGQPLVVNIYRLVETGGTKNNLKWVGKMPREPEDYEIAEQYGPGEYKWLMKWLGPDQKDTGIISETISIDESARSLHEAYLRKNAQAAGLPAALAPSGLASPPPGVGNLTALDLLAFMDKGEEKAIRMMERMSAIVRPAGVDPMAGMSGVMTTVHEAALKVVERSLESSMKMASSAVNKVKEDMENSGAKVDTDDDLDGEGEGEGEGVPGMPDWMAAFLPDIKKYLGTLLGGGPAGGAIKTLIVTSDQWQEIFRDKDKWGQAVSAMEREFGTDKTASALKILLNQREKKAGVVEKVATRVAQKVVSKVKGKGKGK